MTEALNNMTEILEERQLVTFYLGQEEFGVDIMNVRETIRFSEVTKVPQTPDYVEGICNLRGSILPIIDGRSRFGMERRLRDERTRILVVDVNGRVTGIVVDRVSEVLRVNVSDLEPAPAVIRNVDADYLDGVVKLNGGKRLIMALNLGKILTVDIVDTIQAQTVAATALEQVKSSEVDLEEDQLVTFLLGDEEYAFDIMHVKEIIRVPEITAVPNASYYIEGVVSIRSHLLPIVNMRSFFGLEEAVITDQSRVIIIDLGNMSAGFKVDRVMEVIRVPKNVIEPPPVVFSSSESEQIRGVAKLNQGARLLMCLNAQNLLSAAIVKELVGESVEILEEKMEKQMEKQLMEEEQLVAFRLGKEEFAIKITDVQEINRYTDVVRMPGTPAYFDGLVNLRGNIIPVLNLRRRFNMEERANDDSTRIIIVDVGNQKNGVVVDSVSEVLRFERNLVEETPKILANDVDAKYIKGVCKLNNGKRMVMILDLEHALKVG
ncbi:Protein CheW [Candidatus Desulfosporosinus infrequens]|uniref:Protein CheW n=1 Tax=Candidatus Desulfosporosinus infrequens TaxID=2043169 RepID=A0A2U3L127_9FIRM|nr:Protein CheW [Candidatus Desulfosporosinus infrequens]